MWPKGRMNARRIQSYFFAQLAQIMLVNNDATVNSLKSMRSIQVRGDFKNAFVKP